MWIEGTSSSFFESKFRDRIRVISIVFALAYSCLIVRLAYLQLIEGDRLTRLSESNRTQILPLRAPRGVFYDTNGKVLVTNRPSWSLMYSVTEEAHVKFEEVEARLAPLLDPLSDKWRRNLKRAFLTKKMVRLIEDAPATTSFGISEMGELLPGALMQTEFRRGMPEGQIAPHVIGYINEIDERELLDPFWADRKSGDLVGKIGLEKILDKSIRGQDGGMVVEIDSNGRLQRIMKKLPSQIGHSVTLSINADMQKEAMQLLANTPSHRGAVCVIDTETGGILVWASAPAFGMNGTLGVDLIDKDKERPFFDRVYKGAHAPGSVFKLVTAIAGFEKGAIDPRDKIFCTGYVVIKEKFGGQRRFGCWKAHGTVDYWKAMAESCDSYFYRLGEKIGSNAIHDVAVSFGLGDQVQKILPKENSGNIPSAAWKKQRGLGGWSLGDTYNMSIGQGYVTTTPLQIAMFMAALARRGEVFHPTLVKKIVDVDGNTVMLGQKVPWRKIELQQKTWDALQESMRQVVKGGTGISSSVSYLDIYGKTGTAQNSHGEDHAWFAAYGGVRNEIPRLAVCVFVENGGHGGAIAAPIAKRMFEIFFPNPSSPSVQ